MLNKINKYKKQINELLHHNTYSKKTPLNTKTTTKILKHFTFDPYKTYIEINTLEKKDKDKILLEFFEFVKIKEYKNYFDITFKLDENDIKSVLKTIDDFNPETIIIYNINDNKEFEKCIKKENITSDYYNYKIIINLEQQRITIIYKKDLKEITKKVKEINKLFE